MTAVGQSGPRARSGLVLGNRPVNAIIDRIPNTSHKETWKWWIK